MNEVPNNNDIKSIANIVLNKVPNSNDTMHVENNVHLTAVGVQQFSMVAIYSYHSEKPTYQRREIMT